jgi:hypothetical protein
MKTNEVERVKLYLVKKSYSGKYRLHIREVNPQYVGHLQTSGWRTDELSARYAEFNKVHEEYCKNVNGVWNAQHCSEYEV